MMFMMTTPPTTMKTETTPTAVAAMAPVSWSQRFTQRVGREHAEGVVLLRAEVAVGAQQHAHLVLRLHQVVVIDGDADIVHAVAGALGLEVGLDRDHHEVVLRLAEDASPLPWPRRRPGTECPPRVIALADRVWRRRRTCP